MIKLNSGGRYVDDTIAFVKQNEITNVLAALNSYHPSIAFTYEIESNCSIPFLDVNIRRNIDGSFATSVFRKQTNTDIYMHWLSFAPNSWKVGTLRSLIQRAYTISSDAPALNVELEYLKKVFIELNGYAGNLVKNIMNAEHQKHLINIKSEPENFSYRKIRMLVSKKPTMVIPYKGDQGSNLVKRFQPYNEILHA